MMKNPGVFWCCLQLVWILEAAGQHCRDGECAEYEADKPVIFRTGGLGPGFRAVITRKGLDYMNEVVAPLLEKELVELQIPEMSGKTDIKVAKVKYKLKNIHVTEAHIGRSSFESDSNTGLTLQISDISLRVEGKWSYKSWAASDDGSVRIKANGVSLKVGILVGADSAGKPSLEKQSCNFKAGDISVKFKGGASWLYNLFDSVIESKLKDALNTKICNLISEKIQNSASETLASFPTTVTLDKEVKLSYALMSKPVFSSQFVVMDCKGEFYLDNDASAPVPFSPSPLPPPSDSSNKMISLWLTDYVANTAALVYMRLGHLQYNVTPDAVGGDNSFFKLDTSAFSHMVPKLYEKYPDRPLILGLRCTDDQPTLTVTPQGAQLVFPAVMDFYVDCEATALAFTLGFTVSLDLQVWIESTKDDQLLLKANASYVDTDSRVVSSNIGEIDNTAVKSVWDAVSFLCKMFVMPQINRLTNKGFPIPMVKGVEFVDPSLILQDGYMLVETDIKYKG